MCHEMCHGDLVKCTCHRRRSDRGLANVSAMPCRKSYLDYEPDTVGIVNRMRLEPDTELGTALDNAAFVARRIAPPYAAVPA